MAIPASSQTPAGTAGGDLSGSYPNPTVVAGGVAIADLSGYPADGSKYARGDNTWAVIAATQAGSGSGLPAAPGSGAPGRIKAGSSPFDFMTLYYDATLAKWVSAATVVTSKESSATTTTTTGISYGTPIDQVRAMVPQSVFTSAGLAIQMRLVANMRISALGSTAFIACLPQVADAGANWANMVAAEILQLSTGSSSDITVDSGWTDVSITANGALMRTLIRVKVSANTGTYNDWSVLLRWTFTP